MKRLLIASLLVLGSTTTFAEDFSYTYLNASYANIDLDGIDTGDGFGIAGSFAVADNWHVFAGYQGAGFDFDVDATTLNAGVGYNTPVSESIDVVARLSYIYAEVDTPLGSTDDSGYGFGVGLRAMAGESFELNGAIEYAEIDGSGDTAIGGGFLYNFTENFAAGASGSWSDDASTYAISGRFYF